MTLPRFVMEVKQCGAMGKSVPGGDIQVLNSDRISATVTVKGVPLIVHLVPHLLHSFCQHASKYLGAQN